MAASSNIKPSKDETVTFTAVVGAADMTRRMVCGGLAGMIAKV